MPGASWTNGLPYVALQNVTAGTVPGSDPNFWMPLALTGPQGAPGAPGVGLLNFQGIWQPAAWQPASVVGYGGVLYITPNGVMSGTPPDQDLGNWSAISFPLNGTAKNPTGVAALGLTASLSYDPAQIQALADKLDELLAASKRP